MAIDSKTALYVVGGVVALVIVNKVAGIFDVFADTEADKATDKAAAGFDDAGAFPELYDAGALDTLSRSGKITNAMIADSRKRTEVIAAAAVHYWEAKGTFHDNEAAAVTAVGTLSTWLDLLFFAATLQSMHGVMPGPYGQTFLGDGDKASIVRLIINLRKR